MGSQDARSAALAVVDHIEEILLDPDIPALDQEYGGGACHIDGKLGVPLRGPYAQFSLPISSPDAVAPDTEPVDR